MAPLTDYGCEVTSYLKLLPLCLPQGNEFPLLTRSLKKPFLSELLFSVILSLQ